MRPLLGVFKIKFCTQHLYVHGRTLYSKRFMLVFGYFEISFSCEMQFTFLLGEVFGIFQYRIFIQPYLISGSVISNVSPLVVEAVIHFSCESATKYHNVSPDIARILVITAAYFTQRLIVEKNH